MSSRELSEWMAYYTIEPWGEERDDLRAGIIAATIANANRGKNSRAFKPSDFIPKIGAEEAEPKSWQDLLAKVKQINAAVGGTDKTDERGRSKWER